MTFRVFGWLVFTLATVTSVASADGLGSLHPCPNACSGHGRCNPHGLTCECFSGFTGADCSLRLCPFSSAWVDVAVGVDLAHQKAECSNMGLCDRTSGECVCNEGFEGLACERQSCLNHCNGVGECQTLQFYAMQKDPGEGEVFTYRNQWDSKKIHGCRCDPGFHGIDCSLRSCPHGDDPLTGTNDLSLTNIQQHNEIQHVVCAADGGSFTLGFRGETSVPIPYNALPSTLQTAIENIPTIGKGNIKLVMTNPEACSADGAEFTVEFLQNFGELPNLVVDSRRLTQGGTTSSVVLSVSKVVVGSKENSVCSNRGICNVADGVCECTRDFATSNGYNEPGIRGDCGHATNLIQFCPGILSCSGHGKCAGAPTFTCTCADGWTGADCSERLCPEDWVWFDLPTSNEDVHLNNRAECSNAGECDRSTGQCKCLPGFTGASCDRLDCPGSDAGTPCSNHGQCLDMAALADLATVNGNLAGYSYGLVPNEVSTWDAHRIFGCLCDPEYTGYDCSLKTCPTGDDPMTLHQVDEEQYIQCQSSSTVGSLTFTFRQQTTEPIPITATTAEVKAAFERVPAFGEVDVEVTSMSDPDVLCSPANSRLVVRFLTVHGDLPLMTVESELSTISVNILDGSTGTKESIECSGRGLCDHNTGECVCFNGYGSSDGKGGPGLMGDCGYLEPHKIH